MVVETLPIPQNKSKRPQSSVANFLNFNLSIPPPYHPPSPPPVRANHHKQHLLITAKRLLIDCPNFKLEGQKIFFTWAQPATTNSTHPHIILSKHIFLVAPRTSKEKLSIPCTTQKTLRSLDLYQKQKYEILDSLCVSHPWVKPGTQKMRFQPVPNKTFCSKLPLHYRPTNRALQTTKITKLGLLSLPHCFQTEDSLYQNWKANPCSLLLESDLAVLNWNFDLLTIMSRCTFIAINLKHYISKIQFL